MEVLEIINDAIPLFSSLEGLYKELAKLEIEGKVNSPEYENSIANIKLVNEVIDRKFSSLHIEYDEFVKYKEHLIKKHCIEPFDIVNLDEFILNENNYLKRLINQIYYLSKSVSFEFDDFLDEIDLDNIIVETKSIMDSLNNISDLYDNLLLLTLFEYLLEEINKTTSIQVRNQLIQIKYRLLFLYPEIETYCLGKKYTSSRANSFSKYLLKCLKVLDEDLDTVKENYIEYSSTNAFELMTSIKELDDEFFRVEENRIKVLIRVILIRTFASVNFDLKTSQKLEHDKDDLLNATKSDEAKRYLLQSFDLSNRLNIPKMVDL